MPTPATVRSLLMLDTLCWNQLRETARWRTALRHRGRDLLVHRPDAARSGRSGNEPVEPKSA